MALTKRTLIWIMLAGALSLVVLSLTLLGSGLSADGWLLGARHTARLSFVLFLVAFLAPVCAPKLTDDQRRDAFLAFATAHVVHFFALMAYLHVSGNTMNTVQLTVGSLAYLMLIGTAIWLLTGRKFHRWHAHLEHYVLFVFALTYSFRLFDNESLVVGLIGVGLSLIAALLRHFGSRTSEQPNSP